MMLRVEEEEGEGCVLYSATDVCADLVLLFAECGRSDSSTTGRGVSVFAMASTSFALSPMGY